jgi:hypothetical protein
MDDTAVKRELRVGVKKGDIVEWDEVVPLDTQVELGSAEGIRDLAKAQYRPVGYCIYCGDTNGLSREHIVPLGLSGIAVLPKASCASCRKVTGAFEGQVLQSPMMRAVRAYRGLRSRSKHADAPRTQRLKLSRGGENEIVDVPVGEAPKILHFPIFAPPRLLTGESGSGIKITGIVSVLFGPSPEEVLRRLGGQQVDLESAGDAPIAFARMLAKIGWAMAVAEGKHNRLDGASPILPSIRGHVDDIGRWVGTLTGSIRQYPGLLHRVLIHEDRAKGMLIAEIQLFADAPTPSYGVILGHLQKC